MTTRPSPAAIPVGVLGDSDSHSYQDRVLLTRPGIRGGDYRETTLQWTEIWQRLRPDEVDLGAWGTWGTRGTVATLRRAIGMHGRAPPKEDFRFNMATSGARCARLNEGMARQVQPLVELMDGDRERWADGLVIIRIGINDFGQPDSLEAFASAGPVGARREPIDGCLEHVARAVGEIRARHPETRIVLVGILNNATWAKVGDRWSDPGQLARIDEALDVYDEGLRSLASADPSVVFHDDRAWFQGLWGGRSPEDGRPAYRPHTIEGSTRPITNTVGDHPANTVLEDGHFGTAANALWLTSVVELIERTWGRGLTPIRPEEVLEIIDPSGEFGLRR